MLVIGTYILNYTLELQHVCADYYLNCVVITDLSYVVPDA